VFVGLISYSLYLWHWPIIVLHDMGVLLSMGATLPPRFAAHIALQRYDKAVEIILSFLLAILSWRFVERPFRLGSLRLSGRPLFALAGLVMGLFVGASLWIILGSGLPARFPPASIQVASYLDNRGVSESMREGTCFITSGGRFEDYRADLCLREAYEKRNYLLLGDSHSAALWMALEHALPNANIMQANASGCRPFIHPRGTRDCMKMMSYIYQEYLPSHLVQGLFLEDRWTAEDIVGISETVEWAIVHRIPVVVFGPVQDYDAPLPRLLAYSIAWNQPNLPARHRASEDAVLDHRLERLAANTWHIPYISLYKAICKNGDCIEYSDAEHKVPLMFDADHLSPPGAMLVVNRVVTESGLH
jgi:hypothetical protein